jgi:phosphoribosylaminoimidazole-succinocarboxamide synthase
MTDEFVNSVTARYQELYEQVVGEKFVEPVGGNALARIEKNIQAYLGSV